MHSTCNRLDRNVVLYVPIGAIPHGSSRLKAVKQLSRSTIGKLERLTALGTDESVFVVNILQVLLILRCTCESHVARLKEKKKEKEKEKRKRIDDLH